VPVLLAWTYRVTVYICSVSTYVHGCFIGLQEEETADNAGNGKCSLKQYHPLKFLGRGGFGNVRLVKRMSASSSCCKQDLFGMKAVPKDTVSRYIASRRIMEKEVMMRVVGHPFFIQLYSYFQTKVLHSF
jgi:serine/threonine protein kinase